MFPTALPKMLHWKWKMANSMFFGPLCEAVCCVACSEFECGWNSSKRAKVRVHLDDDWEVSISKQHSTSSRNKGDTMAIS